MSRLFIIATGPLYENSDRIFSGQALRTLHFVEPLRDAGHEIDLYLHPISDLDFDRNSDPLAIKIESEKLTYKMLQTNDEDLLIPLLQQQLEAFQPDAVIGINSFPANLACKLDTEKPIWCDLNGWAMVEAQTRARIYANDDCLPHFWRHEKSLLRRGDKFSTVSTPLKYALMGELAMMGRMNRFTFDYDFAAVIPEAVARHYIELSQSGRRADREDSRFRIFWCGSFNTWTDVDLLFETLERAMNEIPDLFFISTGGAIPGHNEKTYQRFEDLVKQSPNAARYSLLGWVEPWVVDSMLMNCDLGINIDSQNYDTRFGARNRITTMIGCGMPVLTTIGTEISRDLFKRHLGLFVEIGDADALLEAIRYAASHRDELKELGRRSREFALAAYDATATVVELLRWSEQPTHAPDNAEKLKSQTQGHLSKCALNPIERLHNVMEAHSVSELLDHQRDLKVIRDKRLFRTAQSLGIFSKINGKH